MTPSLNNITAIYGTIFTATYGVILIILWMELAMAEDKVWSCEFIHP